MPAAVSRPARPRRATSTGGRSTGIRYVDGRHEVDASFRSGPVAAYDAPRCTRSLLGRGDARPASPWSTGAVADVEDAGDHVLVDGEPARHLVAADGLHSPVRRMLGLDAPAGPRAPLRAARARRRAARGRPSSRCTGRAVGEAYVTPVADGLVGVAVLTAAAATFAELLSAFPTLAPRLDGPPDDPGARRRPAAAAVHPPGAAAGCCWSATPPATSTP